MARAYGWNARLLLGFEKTYGNPAAKGSFHLVPFISSSLDSEQGLIESGVLGLGRDPTAPFRDVRRQPAQSESGAWPARRAGLFAF